jgi:hypothetical protein
MSRSKQSRPGRLRSGQRSTKPAERRYSIQSDDSGHDYFVEVGNEGEFEQWLQADFDAEESGQDEGYYEGHNYEENRIDGRFTFTDPRNE